MPADTGRIAFQVWSSDAGLNDVQDNDDEVTSWEK